MCFSNTLPWGSLCFFWLWSVASRWDLSLLRIEVGKRIALGTWMFLSGLCVGFCRLTNFKVLITCSIIKNVLAAICFPILHNEVLRRRTISDWVCIWWYELALNESHVFRPFPRRASIRPCPGRLLLLENALATSDSLDLRSWSLAYLSKHRLQSYLALQLDLLSLWYYRQTVANGTITLIGNPLRSMIASF